MLHKTSSMAQDCKKMRLSLLYLWLSTKILNFNFFFKTSNELLLLKGLNYFLTMQRITQIEYRAK